MENNRYSEEVVCKNCKKKFLRRKSKRTGEKLLGSRKSLRQTNAITCSSFCSKSYDRCRKGKQEVLDEENEK